MIQIHHTTVKLSWISDAGAGLCHQMSSNRHGLETQQTIYIRNNFFALNETEVMM
jgi:hypothetical protein